jgi:hypothetical protein
LTNVNDIVIVVFAWLVKESVFNGAYEPLLLPESGIVKIYGPPLYSARFNRKIMDGELVWSFQRIPEEDKNQVRFLDRLPF